MTSIIFDGVDLSQVVVENDDPPTYLGNYDDVGFEEAEFREKGVNDETFTIYNLPLFGKRYTCRWSKVLSNSEEPDKEREFTPSLPLYTTAILAAYAKKNSAANTFKEMLRKDFETGVGTSTKINHTLNAHDTIQYDHARRERSFPIVELAPVKDDLIAHYLLGFPDYETIRNAFEWCAEKPLNISMVRASDTPITIYPSLLTNNRGEFLVNARLNPPFGLVYKHTAWLEEA